MATLTENGQKPPGSLAAWLPDGYKEYAKRAEWQQQQTRKKKRRSNFQISKKH